MGKERDKKEMFDLFNLFLECMEFGLMYNQQTKKISLVDLQEGSYNQIEKEEFTSLQGIIDRLEVYIDDYFVKDLCNELNIKEDSFKEYKELVVIAEKIDYERAKFDIEILQMIINGCNYKPFSELQDIVNNSPLID